MKGSEKGKYRLILKIIFLYYYIQSKIHLYHPSKEFLVLNLFDIKHVIIVLDSFLNHKLGKWSIPTIIRFLNFLVIISSISNIVAICNKCEGSKSIGSVVERAT